MKKKIEEVYVSGPVQQALHNGELSPDEFGAKLTEVHARLTDLKMCPADERADALHVAMDEMAKSVYSNKEHTVQCKKGCSFCCHQNVDVVWDEAVLLVKRYGHVVDWDKIREQAASEIRELPYEKRACPFLKDNLCSIHEDRPNSCRKYFVASDPDKCNSEKYPNGDIASLYSMSAEILSSCMMTLQDCGPMAKMMLMVKTKKGL